MRGGGGGADTGWGGREKLTAEKVERNKTTEQRERRTEKSFGRVEKGTCCPLSELIIILNKS